MHGFSYINRVSSATIHFSLSTSFDEDDRSEIEEFISSGHVVLDVDTSELSSDDIALLLLSKIGSSSDSRSLIWARFVDALVALSDTSSGLLIVLIVPRFVDGIIPVELAEFMEYFLIAADAWRTRKKPFNLVISDYFLGV